MGALGHETALDVEVLLASILGGGIAPIVSISLARRFDTPFAVSCYLLAMLVLTLIALRLAPRRPWC